MENERTVVVRSATELTLESTRRKFLQMLGVGGSIVLLPSVFAACSTDTPTSTATNSPQTISLASDTGILNFALLLEQTDSSFYTQIIARPDFSTLFSTAEQEALTDFRNDEVLHREFLRAALGSNAIPVLALDFSTVAVNRASLLTTALTIETNGIAAYNGAGVNLKDANNLLLAGKIVSVEARHAATLADILDTTGQAFADLTTPLAAGLGADNTKALDVAAPQSKVLPNVQPFIKSQITVA